MAEPLISIIVPAYNVQAYIEECLISIQKQLYRNIEVIIINDGSTDKTGEICEKFVKADPRFQVFHQKNKGRVLARAYGVEKARGNYIGFVDGDDWLEPEFYGCLIENLLNNHADLVTTGYTITENAVSRTVVDPYEERLYDTKEDLEYILSNYLYSGDKLSRGMIKSQCCKLYKKKILLKVINKISCQLQYNEDCLLNLLYILEIKAIYIGKQTFYHYRSHSDSTVKSQCEDYLTQINMFFLEAKKILSAIEANNCVLRQLDKMVVTHTILGLNNKIGLSGSLYIPWYRFDAEEFYGKRIILYGAGNIGKDYFYQIRRQKNIEIVSWVDKNYMNLRNKIKTLYDVSAILNLEYDIILIAVKSKSLAEKISEELFSEYGIDQKKIVWKEPQEMYFIDL